MGTVRLEQVEAIELFIISAMTTLDAAIVLFASHRIAAQGAAEGLEGAFLQGSDVVGVVSAEL